MDEIVFSAKFRDWISVKKMSIDEKTQNAEVAYMLASVESTLSRKSFEFAGVNSEPIDKYVEQITKGRRKGYANVAEIFSQIKPGELKLIFQQAGPEQIAESYFIRAVLEKLGFSVGVSIEDLQALHPELKFPKPKGNFGGKKKKA